MLHHHPRPNALHERNSLGALLRISAAIELNLPHSFWVETEVVVALGGGAGALLLRVDVGFPEFCLEGLGLFGGDAGGLEAPREE